VVLERCVANHDDEDNAYVRLGHVLSRLGRKDQARAVYEKGVRQAEKHGHSGMADDLRLALLRLND
jgi:Flp pilus assembly protein TadD